MAGCLAQESLSAPYKAMTVVIDYYYAKALWTHVMCPILQTAVLLIYFLVYSTNTAMSLHTIAPTKEWEVLTKLTGTHKSHGIL